MQKIGLILLFLISFSKLSAQNSSSEGRDFWVVFPTHTPVLRVDGYKLANISIFVTSKYDSEATVSCGAYSETKLIPANTSVEFKVDRTASYIEFSDQNKALKDKGIHVKVTEGMPKIAVFAHIYAGARSAATLVLPTESLGQKYYSMNYSQDAFWMDDPPVRNFLTIVAVDDNTSVIIHQKNGVDKKITLENAGDVYEHMGDIFEDLTGTMVEVDPTTSACKKFAAFSGSTAVFIGCYSSMDPLFQQLYDINNWGKQYFSIPFVNRQHFVRILAKEDNTKVTINGVNNLFISKSGAYIKSDALSGVTKIEADKPISVAQYAVSQDCASSTAENEFSDPDMVVLNPVEFKIKNITMFSSSKEAVVERYLNVVMKTEFTSSFKISGTPNAFSWKKVDSDDKFSYAQIVVSDNSMTLSADDGFNAIAYGFGEFESYAYSAGTKTLDLKDLKVLNVKKKYESKEACISQESQLVFYSFVQCAKLKWKIDGFLPMIDDNPTFTEVMINGDKMYKYLSKSIFFNKLGEHKVELEVDQLTSGGCVSRTEKYEFSFQVIELPKADFSFSSLACTAKEIIFTETMNDAKINQWTWDFGDGIVSTDKNPTHIYKLPGTYRVKLTAGVSDGCDSEVIEHDVLVLSSEIVENKKIFKVINLSTGDEKDFACIGQTSKIGFYSAVNLSKITAKIDGKIDEIIENPNSTKATINGVEYFKYLISPPILFDKFEANELVVDVVFADKNPCLPSTAQYEFTIMVKDFPTADFASESSTCSDKPISFKDLSMNSSANKWIWDFGDGSSIVNEQNPSHVYSSPGTYLVKFSIGVEDGCNSNVVEKYIFIYQTPKITFNALPNICEHADEINLLDAVVEETGVSGYFTFKGNGVYGNIFNPKNTTVNTHLITSTFVSEQKCMRSESQNIVVTSLPTLKAGKTIYVAKGDKKRIPFTYSGQDAIFKWTPSTGLVDNTVLNPEVSVERDTEYTLSVIQGGCVLTDKIWVKQQQEVVLYNAFSPNGDGINDLWKIENITHYEDIVLQIFNRYGERVFFQKGDEITPFDGTFNGKK
ncbi:MAG: PKD domain-containing protein, partial [Sphingobacteriaceae bacterium]|nr:PKD domain-containing protein [Sphingobacteriaceae bacterium]